MTPTVNLNPDQIHTKNLSIVFPVKHSEICYDEGNKLALNYYVRYISRKNDKVQVINLIQK